MRTIDKVTAEIITVLPSFGLRVEKPEAAGLAALYVYQRPRTSLGAIVEMLATVDGLPWRRDDTPKVQRFIMHTLVEYLDAMYFVDTWEPDRSIDGS